MKRADLMIDKIINEFKDDNKEIVLAVLTGVLLGALQNYPSHKRLAMFKDMQNFINFRLDIEKDEKETH
jgi:hypothetical protein